jgi:hypothetical protein
MSRIYLDSNVLSNLRREESEKYELIKKILDRNKDYFTFYFSHAHIYDKRKDFSEFKYLDFDFIESLAGDKYISYDPSTTKAETFVAKPLEVYNDFKNENFLSDTGKLLFSDSDYKNLRTIIKNHQENYPLEIGEESFEFAELFKNEAIQQAFVDFVKKTILIKRDGKILYYDFYVQSYLMLDILSIKTERINEKNEFFNLIVDANHSYYGQYFDFFITDDKKLRIKSELLYKKYEVNTEILTPDDFIKKFKDFTYVSELNFDNLFSRVVNEASMQTLKINSNTENTIVFDTQSEYFGYFNEMILMGTGPELKVHIFLNKKAKNHFYTACFREIEEIVNKSITIFGIDSNGLGFFDFESEIQEINSDTWKGRKWNKEAVVIGLYINEGVSNLCFEFVIPTGT